MKGRWYDISDILDNARCTNFFPIFLYSFHQLYYNGFLPTKMDTMKLNILSLLDILRLKPPCLFFRVCLSLQFETSHFEIGRASRKNEWYFFFLTFQPKSDPMYDTRSRWHNVMPSMTQVSVKITIIRVISFIHSDDVVTEYNNIYIKIQ